MDENGEGCIALGAENVRNIVSCLQYFLDINELNGDKIRQRFKTEYDYKAILIPGKCHDWSVGPIDHSVSRWSIKDQAHNIDVDCIIILFW